MAHLFSALRSASPLTTFMLFVTANVLCAAPHAAKPPEVADATSSGRATFRQFCAPCHGPDGKGHGPVAPYLVKTPTDLTQIRRRHNGVFPKDDFESILLAPARSAAPGTTPTQMMLWGPVFLSMDSNLASARARVDDLLAFLESMQED